MTQNMNFFGNALCELENMYLTVGCSSLKRPVIPSSLVVLRSTMSLLIFCLLYLSISVREMLMS